MLEAEIEPESSEQMRTFSTGWDDFETHETVDFWGDVALIRENVLC